MLKKIGVIIAILAIIITSLFVYLNKTKTTQKISPVIEMKTVSGTTYIESGSTQNENEWDPNVMRVGQPIKAQTGATITVSTNGPTVRSMTPEELAEFQKKIQGK